MTMIWTSSLLRYDMKMLKKSSQCKKNFFDDTKVFNFVFDYY